MNVTIYTDASFREGDVGIACWCRSNRGRIVSGKHVPEGLSSVQEAEALAVLHALRAVHSAWPDGDMFYIMVDNTSVIAALRGRKPLTTELGQRIVNTCLRYLRGKSFTVRHVKAHTGGHDVRSYLNDQCDRLSKAARMQ